MKCNVMWHLIWVFTVCQSTPLGVFSIQRVYNIRFNGAIENRVDIDQMASTEAH